MKSSHFQNWLFFCRMLKITSDPPNPPSPTNPPPQLAISALCHDSTKQQGGIYKRLDLVLIILRYLISIIKHSTGCTDWIFADFKKFVMEMDQNRGIRYWLHRWSPVNWNLNNVASLMDISGFFMKTKTK